MGLVFVSDIPNLQEIILAIEPINANNPPAFTPNTIDLKSCVNGERSSVTGTLLINWLSISDIKYVCIGSVKRPDTKVLTAGIAETFPINIKNPVNVISKE